MTNAAVACLYLLLHCAIDPLPPTAPPVPHDEGHWVIYLKEPDGRERAQVYRDAHDCSFDAAIYLDTFRDASLCYELL